MSTRNIKLVQITFNPGYALYGLDKEGQVWRYDYGVSLWSKVSMETKEN